MISRHIGRIFGRPAPFPPVEPSSPFYVIGDVHGRADLLGQLLERLELGVPVICVGDYIDRGEHSARVLRLLRGRRDIRCLMGNHEQMLLRFLDEPERRGRHWLRNGGLQTLASFGIAGLSDSARGADLRAARNALRKAMGDDLIDWIAHLPTIYRDGNVAVVHAGADPEHPIDDQAEEALLWGHPRCGRTPRRDGIWIAHGHTIVDRPRASEGIISVDTGAYATGRLTAALVEAGRVSFVST